MIHMSFIHARVDFSVVYCSRSTNMWGPGGSRSSSLEVLIYIHKPELLEITFVVSRDVATHTRSMTLDGPSSWRSRSKILEISRSPSRWLFLVMFSHWVLVTPAIVRACRCFVYCTGGPPPGIVSCAGTLYSWRHIAFCVYFACAPLLDVVLLCMCMCMCKCTCMSCAGAVQVQVLVLCGCSVQVFFGVRACMRYTFFFFFSPLFFLFYTCLLHR